MTASRPPAANPAVTDHPLFPAVVAVWFAVLFGLGCAVLPIGLWERVMVATGIAGILPPAAPPLGTTARLLIAITAAMVGLVLGYVVARRVVGGGQTRIAPPEGAAHDERDDAAPAMPEPMPDRRPISAREELGAESFDAPDFTPPAPPSDAAPFAPAMKVPDDGDGDAAQDGEDDSATGDAGDPEPFERVAPVGAAPDLAASEDAPGHAIGEPAIAPPARPFAAPPIAVAPVPPPPSPAPSSPTPSFAAPVRDSGWLAVADLAGLSLPELTERLAHAMAHHRPAAHGDGDRSADTGVPVAPFPFAPEPAGDPQDADATPPITTEAALRAALATLQRMDRAS